MNFVVTLFIMPKSSTFSYPFSTLKFCAPEYKSHHISLCLGPFVHAFLSCIKHSSLFNPAHLANSCSIWEVFLELSLLAELAGPPLASHHNLNFLYLSLSHHLEIACWETDSLITLNHFLASTWGFYLSVHCHLTCRVWWQSTLACLIDCRLGHVTLANGRQYNVHCGKLCLMGALQALTCLHQPSCFSLATETTYPM